MSSGSSRPRMSTAALGDAAEAGGLAVAEDAAPGEALGGLAHGDGLREEHGGVGVVAGGEVLEGDAAEQRVVVAGALQLGQPVGPDHAQHDRFEVAVRVAVLRVHREDDQVLEAVRAAPRRAGRRAASRGSRARRSRRRPSGAGRRRAPRGRRRRAAAAGTSSSTASTTRSHARPRRRRGPGRPRRRSRSSRPWTARAGSLHGILERRATPGVRPRALRTYSHRP